MKSATHRQAAALLLGLASVAGFAPAGLSFLPVLCLALLVYFWLHAPSPRTAARLGFLYGLGFFGGGVSWVYVSLHEFGMMPAALAVLATALFCAYLALFPALVGSLQARFEFPAIARALVLVPAFWILTEWMRGWIFTGFPWLALGYSQTDTPLAGYAPVAGMYGVSLAMALCAGALAAALSASRAALRIGALALAAFIYVVGALLGGIAWTTPAGPPLPVTLVQGNIEQSLKFEPARYQATLELYRRLVESARGRLVVLPETAIPRLLDTVDPAYLDDLVSLARERHADLLIGVPFRDRSGRYYNGVVNLGESGLQFYAKQHLVPLGEFVPPEFSWIVSELHIPLSDFSRGGSQSPMRAAGQHVAMTVCYENAFGEELIAELPQGTLLANVSNVAWFGDSLAPAQHLQISRMRSIETGRYMLQSTNTGITALIDERGRVKARVAQFTEALLEGEAQPFAGATPYVRYGNALVLIACALALIASVLLALVPARGSRQ